MGKSFVWLFLSIGLTGIVLDIFVRSGGWALFGTLIFISTLLIALGPDGVLRKEDVIETWSSLIEGAQGKAEGVLTATAEFLEQTQAPNLQVETVNMSPSMVQAIVKNGRTFLTIQQQDNNRLAPYQMFTNARDYGLNLVVDWHLTFRPTVWQGLQSLFFTRTIGTNPLLDLNLFDQQDLTAYVTNAHRCLLKAVDAVILSLHQDPSLLERKSRGFLGIS